MALFNYATKEITLKIVYYGPGLSGKTTNLQHLHQVLNPETKGKLLSLSTESDRTLFFDFLPVELGKIRDFSIRFQLYTVPGQVRYNATRKVVLKGADAVIFVADSQREMKEQNLESFENMRENLVSNNIDPDAIPIILQYNKRDLSNILSIDELNQDLNGSEHYDVIEATAINGGGVEETFRSISKLLLRDIARKHKIEIQPADQKAESVKPIPAAEPVISKETPVNKQDAIGLKVASSPAEETFEISILEEAEEESEVMPEQETAVVELQEEIEPIKRVPGIKTIVMETEESELESLSSVAAFEPVAPSQEMQLPPLDELPDEITAPSLKMDERCETVENISGELAMISVSLRRISDSVGLLQEVVSDLKNQISSIKRDIALSRETSSPAPEMKEIRELRELRQSQKEIVDMIRHISETVGSLQEKKSWFRFK